MEKHLSIGNFSAKSRSDCRVTLTITDKGGREINMKSKVDSMFGKSNRALINEILDFFDIQNANILVEDKGALPFVIAARLEAAIKVLLKTEKEFLLPLLEENHHETAKDKFRFSRLYLPGNSPSMMINAGIHHPNGIILDLEDSVSPDKKHEARYLVRNALRSVNFYGAERMVRINQGKTGIEELKFLIPHGVNMILLPKCETAEYIQLVDQEVARLKNEHQINTPIWYMPIIESALGVENAFEIAKSSPNVASIAIGLEDFTADLGVQRTNEATESLFARMRLVNACKATGIQPIDSVFSDTADMEGLAKNVCTSKSLGFEGMGCIHPRQITVIHKNFAPEKSEIEKALKIKEAFDIATAEGKGVVSLGSKMIDPPVVKRALTTIHLAQSLNLI